MKKTFKDYAHLYLGCDVKFDGKFWVMWRLSEVYADLKVPAPSDRTNCAYIEEAKPLLRPLSDMKINEGAWCLGQTFFDHVSYPISDFKFELVGQNKQNPRISINNDWYKENLTFGNSNGSIWAVDAMSANVKIKSTLFAYLLKQGFDLFGLIDAGIAIDKTKI